MKPPHPCSAPGCHALTVERFCAQHKGGADAHRGNAAERGYDARWQRYRKAYLAGHPLCVLCKAEGKVQVATVVDHIRPHRGNDRLMWDEANHQALCKRCHDRKTATHDRGNP